METKNNSGEFTYDVAFSFAGQDRDYVRIVAETLKSNKIKVFFDEYEKVKLWGKDLGICLDKIYRLQSKFCVIFISKFYLEKEWTNHEIKSALSRAIMERGDEYILPARFDDTDLPGIPPTLGYIDISNLPPEKFAYLLLEKLGQEAKLSPKTQEPSFRVPKLKKTNFNPYEEAFSFMTKVKNELEHRCKEIAHLGVSATVFSEESKHKIRIFYNSKIAYSLNMWLNETLGEGTISFYGVQRRIISNDSGFNAWGNIVQRSNDYSRILQLTDMSFLNIIGHQSELEIDGFIEALWDRICEIIENNNTL